MSFCKYFCRSNSSFNRDSAPIEACTLVRIMNSECQAVHLTDLCSLLFRVLPKLLGLPPSLLKKFHKYERVHHPQLIDTAMGTSPELSQDILFHIFTLLEFPHLVCAGSVCSTWHATYTSLYNVGKCKQSQARCLLYTSESVSENVACLYNLAEKKMYRLTLPEPPIRSRFLIGSSQGCLLTVDERFEMHIVIRSQAHRLLALR